MNSQKGERLIKFSLKCAKIYFCLQNSFSGIMTCAISRILDLERQKLGCCCSRLRETPMPDLSFILLDAITPPSISYPCRLVRELASLLTMNQSLVKPFINPETDADGSDASPDVSFYPQAINQGNAYCCNLSFHQMNIYIYFTVFLCIYLNLNICKVFQGSMSCLD